MSSVEEGVFYISEGSATDKSQQGSVGLSLSLHTSSSFQAFRQCSSHRHGFTFINGFQDKLVVASPNKALILVYSPGKELPDQRIPIPEELVSLTSCTHPQDPNRPWLLAGGSKSGKLYIWELGSGLLLQVRDLHYQAVSVLRFSHDGAFIVSGSLDSRILVWKTFDLISSLDQDTKTLKPYATFTDHTLAINDIVITKGQLTDIKLYSCSDDSTVRCYHLHTKSLVTTFVAPEPVRSLCIDSAERMVFAGYSSGLIRQIPLYIVDPLSRTLEKVGGNSKIITIAEDPELKYTFLHHRGSAVTSMLLSIDSSCLCSGDALGNVYASDIVTRQVLKKFKELNFGIAGVLTFLKDSNTSADPYTLPVLKRVIAGEKELDKHEILKHNNWKPSSESFDLKSFINQAKQEEIEFLNLSQVDSQVSTVTVTTNNDDKKRIEELEEQLLVLNKGYADLRKVHQELYSEHVKLVNGN